MVDLNEVGLELPRVLIVALYAVVLRVLEERILLFILNLVIQIGQLSISLFLLVVDCVLLASIHLVIVY